MQEGTVKFFNETKGYGFINDTNSGKDIFVHLSGLIDKINENDKVSYEIEESPKGLNAIDVRVIS